MNLTNFHHRQARAFIEIGGQQVPAYYQSAADEFLAAKKAAVMDRSFVGKLRVSGKDREPLIHRLTTNEMRNLPAGGGVVNIFTNAKGRVVDVVEMFMEKDGVFFLTTPGRANTVKEWIEKYTFIEDVRSEEVTAPYGMISLFGEESAALLQRLFHWPVNDLPAHHVRTFVDGGNAVMVQRSGIIAPVQFNLILAAAEMEKYWNQLTAQATPIGYATYEMLRLHRSLPGVGKEITEEYNPHEVGLFPFINFEKGCYIGQEVIARLDTYQKVQRRLMGVVLEIDQAGESHWSPASAPIYMGGQLIGQLTSACWSPERAKGIGLAVVRKQFAEQTEPIQIRWPEREVAGKLEPLPFEK